MRDSDTLRLEVGDTDAAAVGGVDSDGADVVDGDVDSLTADVSDGTDVHDGVADDNSERVTVGVRVMLLLLLGVDGAGLRELPTVDDADTLGTAVLVPDAVDVGDAPTDVDVDGVIDRVPLTVAVGVGDGSWESDGLMHGDVLHGSSSVVGTSVQSPTVMNGGASGDSATVRSAIMTPPPHGSEHDPGTSHAEAMQ